MEIYRKPLLMFHAMISISIALNLQYYGVDGAQKVPCYFIFGDSLSDNGNNNGLQSNARADYRPYGIDFPKANTPTGRFTNGRNLADFIAESLGFDNYIPSFKTAKGWDIIKGVNYASGAAGIRDESGRTMGARTSFNNQLKNHGHTVSQISGLLKNNKVATAQLLKKCIYTINIGSNDYLNNYFMPQSYTTSTQYNPQQYAIALIHQLSHQLKYLYGQGARKVAIFGLGLVGCTPFARAHFDTKGSPCVQSIHDAIQLFNAGLKSLVDDLNSKLGGANFTFIDVFQISITPTSNQGNQLNSTTPCCEVAPGQLQCVPNGKVCENRNQYIFWDAAHPTEIGFLPIAKRSFNAQLPTDTHPFDINHLAQF